MKSAYVRKAQKSIHYTLTPINNLGDWKKEQAKLEADWQAGAQARYEDNKGRAVAIITGVAQPKVSVEDLYETAYLDGRNAPPTPAAHVSFPSEILKESKTVWQSLKDSAVNSLAKLWSGANFGK